MIRRILSSQSILLMIILTLLLVSCEDDSRKIADYTFNDVGCPEPLGKSIAGSEYLYDTQLDGDQLTLDFRFRTTCGRAFMDSVSIIDNMINISLKDTASSHSRCSCEHQCLFEFEIDGMNDVELKVDMGYPTADGFVWFNAVDTLLIF